MTKTEIMHCEANNYHGFLINKLLKMCVCCVFCKMSSERTVLVINTSYSVTVLERQPPWQWHVRERGKGFEGIYLCTQLKHTKASLCVIKVS